MGTDGHEIKGTGVSCSRAMTDLDVRPLRGLDEVEAMVDYFLEADHAFLRGMGVDPAKLGDRATWIERVLADAARDDREKQTCQLGWTVDGVLVGHSSLSKLRFGEEAHIHLHLWRSDLRRGGIGTELFRRSANAFLRRFELKRLWCEPFADNPAPNRTLVRLGFRFVERVRTVPGAINFEQDVNRYELTRDLV